MQGSISYVDLGAGWDADRESLLPRLERVLASGAYINGHSVHAFEEEVCDFLGVNHCVSLNSGTDALVCALIALGIGKGDKVITPPNSFVASTAAIVHIGAVPVFCDVGPDQNIAAEEIHRVLETTDGIKAVMPVHLTGRVCQMDKINDVAARFGIHVVEDAAQAFGAKYSNRYAGTFGAVGCFSAHPLKNLNACGDAGFLVTDHRDIASKVRLMRNHGLVDRDTVEHFGYVSRMDSIQAEILRYRLEKLANTVAIRQTNANIYNEVLKNFDLRPYEEVRTGSFDTFHTFVIQTSLREDLKKFLENNNVETAIHYPTPIHLQPACRFLKYKNGDFPIAEMQADQILSLPINENLDGDHIMHVAKLVRQFLEGVNR